jgi:hypothetical protein
MEGRIENHGNQEKGKESCKEKEVVDCKATIRGTRKRPPMFFAMVFFGSLS